MSATFLSLDLEITDLAYRIYRIQFLSACMGMMFLYSRQLAKLNLGALSAEFPNMAFSRVVYVI